MKRTTALATALVILNILLALPALAAPNDDLIKACVKGDAAGATMAIENGADVNYKDKNGFTPLHIASNFGKIKIVKLLAAKGADLSMESANGDTALAIAEAKGHRDVIDFLKSKSAKPAAESAIKSEQKPEEKQPAAQAGLSGKPRKALPAAKIAELNEKLLDAALKGDMDKVKSALADGADVNARNSKGSTILVLSVNTNNRDMFKMALDKGAAVDIKDDSGNDAMACALAKGNDLFIDALFERGAKLDIKEGAGYEFFVNSFKTKNHGLTRKLIERTENALDLKIFGNPILFHFIICENVELTKALIEKGIDVNYKDADGKTVLMYAAENKLNEIVELLKKKGADVSAKDKRGHDAEFYSALDHEKVKYFNEMRGVMNLMRTFFIDNVNKGTGAEGVISVSKEGEKTIRVPFGTYFLIHTKFLSQMMKDKYVSSGTKVKIKKLYDTLEPMKGIAEEVYKQHEKFMEYANSNSAARPPDDVLSSDKTNVYVEKYLKIKGDVERMIPEIEDEINNWTVMQDKQGSGETSPDKTEPDNGPDAIFKKFVTGHKLWVEVQRISELELAELQETLKYSEEFAKTKDEQTRQEGLQHFKKQNEYSEIIKKYCAEIVDDFKKTYPDGKFETLDKKIDDMAYKKWGKEKK